MPDDDRLGFPDEPRSELEQTIEELVERAHRVLATQGRLRNLLDANRIVVEQSDVDGLLRSIGEAALSLVDAQYCATGLFAPDGQFEQLVRVGVLPADEEIGAEVPFPDGRGPSGAFLGVPILVRGAVIGGLHLTGPPSIAFTSEDEELVAALAATAGIAIDNARLLDESRGRQRWSTALADVTSALLAEGVNDVLAVTADRLASTIDADLVCVVVRGAEDGTLVVETAHGTDAELIEGRVYPGDGTLAGQALTADQITAAPGDVSEDGTNWQPGIGPTLAIPLRADGRALGVITLSRASGGPRYSDFDLQMAAEFARQATVAIELTRARLDRQRLELVDERSRIARDLHDRVIQRLYGTGLALQALAVKDPEHDEFIRVQVETIDGAIAEIRTAVFALSQHRGPGTSSIRYRLLGVVNELSPRLPGTPRVTFGGAVDLLVRDDLADDVVAVVRELLANVAQHASAASVDLDVVAGGEEVVVTVDDDGVGVAKRHDRSSGTANMRERARAHAGTFTLELRATGGTRARWIGRLPLEAVPG